MIIDKHDLFVADHENPSTDRSFTPVTADEPNDGYLRNICLDFFHIVEDGDVRIWNGESERAALVATLSGTLILGRYLDQDGWDYWEVCDAESGDLEAFETDAEAEGLLRSPAGKARDVLYIHELEMAKCLVDSDNPSTFFAALPSAILMHCNVWPDIMAYYIASAEGFYEKAAERAELDPRSVDGYSPLLYTENGFTLSDSGNIVYRLTDGIRYA